MRPSSTMGFGRIAVRIAVAAVVHGQHRHAGEQLAGVAHHPRHFFGAAAEIHDGRMRPRPAASSASPTAGAVGGAQHDGRVRWPLLRGFSTSRLTVGLNTRRRWLAATAAVSPTHSTLTMPAKPATFLE
jgi:hypothetical protein